MIWQKRFGIELIAIVAMTAVVTVLAVYQYRWTAEISRTEQVRLRNSLATSVRNFDQEFSYDFQQLCESFELDPEAGPGAIESHIERQLAHWSRTSTRGDLVAGVYFWRTLPSNADGLESFSLTDNRPHVQNWPPDFAPVRDKLNRQRDLLSSSIADRDAVYYPWTFFGEAAALARPIFQIVPGTSGDASEYRATGILIVALNRAYLERTYFPELVDRHFGAPGQKSFVVAVRSGAAPPQSIYLSDPGTPIMDAATDSAVNLFDLVGDESRRRGHPAMQAGDAGDQWQFVAKHPAGSLEEAVDSWRRRNLSISLGLLAILAGSVAIVFTAARRSRALARTQMEFVAGVSHELCTPLAIINTAAENLADGVVENTEQMQEYGGLIRGQGRRLERLVDEVLLYTAGRFGLGGYELEPVEVGPMIAQGLYASEGHLREAGFTVEKQIDAQLPLIVADPAAVVTCIENLLNNAMKYSDASKWVAIRAYKVAGIAGSEVCISVRDKGIGISASNLAHIFERFYRAQEVRDNQIRGVGLGLYLVKRMMEDMGGSVSVTSEPGRGTEAILHFPVARSAEPAERVVERRAPTEMKN
ncbi:MAG TPA: HAMP domain-containing sensor histidine kinase [Bryobacteraceae bacterium]|nr:HAMP domain-containing sensor histidine kinase [Bryobacteraceae bacterium]